MEVGVYRCRGGGELAALRGLLVKTLASGRRAFVQTAPEVLDALDRELWLGGEGNFLPHGKLGDENGERQPVLLTDAVDLGGGIVNGAEYYFRYLFGGGGFPGAGSFARGFVIVGEGGEFDSGELGGDYRVSWWRQETGGGWRRESESGGK
ncbi:MAG: DNA polymerase III subunit chi [Alphaproteobacteria bacterium]|nr:DNA polymerase III subunit chi [Alphaproteobacteria bacterium]MDA8004271.1 DNA polymerase III subunit chi [Alphaproteobacteria bacterium]MDA8005654.1 DNA polymerase III subunit chi [Alphaproteobacteria bacterium]MDA8012918.1 DNA polymerase III subunit chi [Alphaproteobacteria bacterium]